MRLENRFRWASLQLDLLCALKFDRDVRSRLGRLPPKLEELYIEIYDHLISGPGEADRNIVENALKWLLCVQTTLSSSEFLWAVAIKAEVAAEDVTKDVVLESCHNLIVYDESLDVFRFAHLSVREFLERKPDYTQTSCHSLAAESCLLYMIGSVSYPLAARALTDNRIVELQERVRLADGSIHTGLLDYANDWWIYHCQLALQDARMAERTLMQILHNFMLSGHIYNIALHKWVVWFCSLYPKANRSQSLESMRELQTLLSSCPTRLSRAFFLSVACGFNSIVGVLLQKGHLRKKGKAKALALAAVFDQGFSFDILMDNDQDLEISSSILLKIIKFVNRDRLARLLERSRITDLEQSLVKASLKGGDEGKLAMLLKKYPGFTVAERTLKKAVKFASPNAFELLLSRTADNLNYRDVVAQIIQQTRSYPLTSKLAREYLDMIRIVLKRAGNTCIAPDVVALAIDEYDSNDAVLQVFLDHGYKGMISEEAMISAASQKSRRALDKLLFHGGNITQRVLLEAAESVRVEVLEVLVDWGCDISSSVLVRAANGTYFSDQKDTGLRVLLQLADEKVIAEGAPSLLLSVASNDYASPELLISLLDQTGEAPITEDILMFAADDTLGESKKLQLLLGRARITEISECVVIKCLGVLELDGVLHLLERLGTINITEDLLESAAGNSKCGDEIVSVLLRKADLVSIPERAVIKAMINWSRGDKVIAALEDVFGPVELTENMLLSFIYQTSHVCHLVSRWLTPEVVTERVLIAAMEHKSPELPSLLAEKSSHLAITVEILEAAARKHDVNLFKSLWNRGRLAVVPERLIEAAIRNTLCGLSIVKFLLDEAEEVRISDQLYVTVLKQARDPGPILNLMRERGPPVEISQTILEAATKGPSGTIEKLLKLNSNLEITDKVFRARAACGEEDDLYCLAKYCGMERPPSKLVNVARLYNAVRRGDIIALEDLIACDVEVNILDPEGYTPLHNAVSTNQVSITKLLLSAGAKPDLTEAQETPLFRAVKDGHLGMVKVLIEAGASVDFKNSEGETPGVAAWEWGYLEVFGYLEQCRKAKEQADEKTWEAV